MSIEFKLVEDGSKISLIFKTTSISVSELGYILKSAENVFKSYNSFAPGW